MFVDCCRLGWKNSITPVLHVNVAATMNTELGFSRTINTENVNASAGEEFYVVTETALCFSHRRTAKSSSHVKTDLALLFFESLGFLFVSVKPTESLADAVNMAAC